MDEIIELPIKNRKETVKIDKKHLNKFNDKQIRFYDGEKRKFLYTSDKNFKMLKLITLLYKPGTGSRIQYLDGDKFNLTSKNIKIIKSIKKQNIGTSKTKQIRNENNYTIIVKDKMLKFDKEDFLKLKNYTLIPRKQSSYVVYNKKLKVNTTLQKFLFNVNSKVIKFKDNDYTNFKKDNLEFIDIGIGSILYKKTKKEFIGIIQLRHGYSIIAKCGNEIFNISLNCTKLEAALIYNYKTREFHNNKTLQINYTGLTISDENKIAEKILKENKEYYIPNKKYKNGTSKYYGVSYNKQLKRWMCRTTFNKKKYYLGIFNEEIDAALAYNKKVIEILGNKAKLNVIQ